MAKPNYAFEKRQRELEKQRKKSAKAQRKSDGGGTEPASPSQSSEPAAPLAAPNRG